MKSSRNRSWAGNFGFSYTNCIDTLSINSMLEDYDFSEETSEGKGMVQRPGTGSVCTILVVAKERGSKIKIIQKGQAN